MPFSNHPPKAPEELALHKAALIYHRQKHSLPPMQQVQRTPVHPPNEMAQRMVGISTPHLISIGNIFQDGIASLPVMYLSEHHLARLQELRAQRPKDFSYLIVEKRSGEENERVEASEKMEKDGSLEEDQSPTTHIITPTRSVPFLNIRKVSQTKLQKVATYTSSKKLFKKSSEKSSANEVKEKVEEEVDNHVKTAAVIAPSFKPDPLTITNDPNWPLRSPRILSPRITIRRSCAECIYDRSENNIAVEGKNRAKDCCYRLKSNEIRETVLDEKCELDSGALEGKKPTESAGERKRAGMKRGKVGQLITKLRDLLLKVV
ncbi:hypothetical protein EAF04_003532 [Stromatinia cepivora]|nr:hypothetical protein EAF04_003532 [Stromatinia cepivora]